MPIQIANPDVVAKIERLSRMTGLGKTAAVEAAVTKMIEGIAAPGSGESWSRFSAILNQIQALPVRSDAVDVVEYDDQGLPK